MPINIFAKHLKHILNMYNLLHLYVDHIILHTTCSLFLLHKYVTSETLHSKGGHNMNIYFFKQNW
jgi:hypothetical protein